MVKMVQLFKGFLRHHLPNLNAEVQRFVLQCLEILKKNGNVVELGFRRKGHGGNNDLFAGLHRRPINQAFHHVAVVTKHGTAANLVAALG